MKKLLSLLATVSLVSFPTLSVVACGNGNGDPIDENEDDNTDDQDQDQDQDQDISTIISVTDLGDINFYSLTGNDTQTQTEIINQVKNLNPDIGNAQITVTDINQTNRTAVISAENFIGSVSVSFTPIISIDLIITNTNLGNVSFYSLTGNDTQTQTEIINQVKSLNPDVDAAQITVTDINQTNRTAIISAENFVGSVSVSFTPIISIELIITNTNLGNISFYSLTGNDTQTQTEIINQVKSLNPDVDAVQITVIDVNRTNGTAIISAENFAGTAEVTFVTSSIVDDIEIPPLINFPPIPYSALQLQNGSTLVGGGDQWGGSFLATFNLNDSNPQTEILGTGLTPNTIRSMIQLRDGRVLVTGGQTAGPTVFLSIINFSGSTFQVQNLIPNNFALWTVNSMIELQDGRILIASGTAATNSFLAIVDLSESNPQSVTVLPAGSFTGIPRSMTQLEDGTILVAGGTAAGNSFLTSVDLSNETPQTQTLLTNFAPAQISSMVQIQDRRILISGGTTQATSFLISVDLSDETPQTQTLLTNFAPAEIRSMIKLQNGRILIIGFSQINWEDVSFLMII